MSIAIAVSILLAALAAGVFIICRSIKELRLEIVCEIMNLRAEARNRGINAAEIRRKGELLPFQQVEQAERRTDGKAE